jgi:hypothetical protein
MSLRHGTRVFFNRDPSLQFSSTLEHLQLCHKQEPFTSSHPTASLPKPQVTPGSVSICSEPHFRFLLPFHAVPCYAVPRSLAHCHTPMSHRVAANRATFARCLTHGQHAQSVLGDYIASFVVRPVHGRHSTAPWEEYGMPIQPE